MLKCVNNIEEIDGKTIRLARIEDSDVIVSFTDDTFIWLRASTDDGEQSDMDVMSYHYVLSYVSDLALDAGVVTKEEYDEHRSKKEWLREKLERERYEVLKAKFEKESK